MSVFQVQQQEYLSIMINHLHTKIYFLNKTYSHVKNNPFGRYIIEFLGRFLQAIFCRRLTSFFRVKWFNGISTLVMLHYYFCLFQLVRSTDGSRKIV